MKTLDQWSTSRLARQLLDQHGLTGWKFAYDRAKRRAGCCKHRTQTVSLSINFVIRNNDDEIKDTLLHEIAHALAGPGHGHDAYWKNICRKIGAKPVRCYDSNEVSMPKGRYKAVCGGCQKVFHRHRRPKRSGFRYCPACGPERGLLCFRA